jgi:putative membrane protein insertion efficiency factor
MRDDASSHNHADHEPVPPPVAPGPVSWLALRVIAGYRRFLSPLLPPACRFVPTCSEYGYEAIAKYGIIRGGRLAVWRVLRCNPFVPGGFDPVP